MSILISEDRKELIVTCHCGCQDSLHIKIDGDDDDDDFSFLSYTNGNFYREQQGTFRSIGIKLRKIMAIIRNKDYYYSDIIMTRDDWEHFKAWVNSQ